MAKHILLQVILRVPSIVAKEQLFIKAAFFVSIHFQLVRIPACHLAMGETRSSPVHTAEKQLFIKAAFFVSIHFRLVRIPACHLAMGETCSCSVHTTREQLLF